MRRIFSSKIFFLIILIAVFSAIFFLDFKDFLNVPKNYIRCLVKPVAGFFYKTGGNTTQKLSALFSVGHLVEQNDFLREQNIKLQASLAKLAELERENELLKGQMETANLKETNLIFANVFGQSPISVNQLVVIDKGINDGILEGAAVLGIGNVLVGKVLEIYSSSATILSIADKISAVRAISQEKRIVGILRGDGTGGLIFEIESAKESPRQGEKIITAGESDIFPKGLLIGEAEKDISIDAEALKKIRIKQSIESGVLENVFVVSK
jgi:rod shape-determining protein MreC